MMMDVNGHRPAGTRIDWTCIEFGNSVPAAIEVAYDELKAADEPAAMQLPGSHSHSPCKLMG